MQIFIILLLFVGALANENSTCTLGMSEANPASSCNEIYQCNPTSRGTIGHYWIMTDEGLFKVKCNMKLKCGGVEGGWMQVVDVDMNRDDSCPGTWHRFSTLSKRLCIGYTAGCSSAYFYAKGYTYDTICGQARAYQRGSPDAFSNFHKHSFDGPYVDGISITLGSPRKHVWTYAAGLGDDFNNHDHSYCCNCPCAVYPGPPPPAYVKNDYYCESGDVGSYDVNALYLNDTLWDGHDCTAFNGCCDRAGMPWFFRKLLTHVTEDFEIRICKDGGFNDEDIAVEKLDIFIL